MGPAEGRPAGEPARGRAPSADGRVDERDTVFARMARREGTPAYEDYYRRRPELKEIDDRLRRMPGLCSPDALHYDPAVSPEAERWFEAIEEIEPDPAVTATWAPRIQTSDDPASVLEAFARRLGAVAAGCAPVDPAWVYTHRGRFDEEYGEPVELDHPSALVFLVEMDHDEMRRAPLPPTVRESARQYYRAALIGRTVAAALRVAGSDARAHYDAHYEVILPPLAVAAGLGELGRNNILVADRYGSRVRIGAVTTDLPLRHGEPVSLGVEEFCLHCRKCAENCPARALSPGEKVEVRGVRKWPTRVEQCHGYWRRIGTDCGICMAGCPFSHPDNAFHNAVRRTLRAAPWLAPVARFFDDLVYGREWEPAGRPQGPGARRAPL